MGPFTCSDALDVHICGASDSAVWSLSVVASHQKDDLHRAYGENSSAGTGLHNGALRSTSTKALETILGIDPIDIHAQLTAGKAAQRLVT